MSEEWLHHATSVLVLLVESAGALIIFLGAAVGFGRFVRALLKRQMADFTPVRLDVGRYLALGLEFQLAADLLRTAVTPTFEEIGKLAAVATIRTALNFFLAREIREERGEIAKEQRSLA